MATTLLQPFGEGVCPKGTHHPPGLGQGPGQGERFASDGSYISKGNAAAVGNAAISDSSNRDSCVSGDVAVDGRVPGAGVVTVTDGADAAATSSCDQEQQQQQQKRCSSDGHHDDPDAEIHRTRPLSIVLPKMLPPESSPTSAQQLSDDWSRIDLDSASIDPSTRTTTETIDSSTMTTARLLTGGVGVEAKSTTTSGLGKGIALKNPPGDAGIVAPDRVPFPPPGSVMLVKPRVTRARLKVRFPIFVTL